MLIDIASDVVKRKCKKSIGQMFCVENELVKKTLYKWFNKNTSHNLIE